MKTKTNPDWTTDELQQRLERMTDQELRRLCLRQGRTGERAFITLSERNAARHPRNQFRLK